MDEREKNRAYHRIIGILKVTGITFNYMIVFLLLLITASIMWMFRIWNGLTMNELVFHLQAPLEGTDKGIIYSYILSCLIPVLVILLVVGVIYKFIHKRWILMLTVTLLSAGFAGWFVSYTWDRLEISQYASNQNTYSTFIDDHYVAPNSTALQFPEKKRNLIYIFLESMENTYASKEYGGAFPKNVIPELTALSNENENFSGDHETLNGGVPMTGATWTVAGMFAQTSGLPLNIPIESNSMNTQDSFFPGLTTLGDILKKEGYHQSLLIGSSAEFGGRKLYFTEHGDYEMWDYVYSKINGEIPDDYYVFWGYEDKRLFTFAKEHLLDVAKSEEPFNFTMLTVDTHFEDGYLCEECPDTFGDNQYANVMACSSRQVKEFVDWIQQQDFYENTTIVISGDHLTMDSDFCKDVEEDYQRKVYTTYINAPVTPVVQRQREYSTFDNFPTTLAALNVEIQGERLGLGTNLFSGEPTLLEKYGKEVMNAELGKKSAFMDQLTENIVVPEPEDTEGATAEATEDNTEITGEITVTPYDYHSGKYEVLLSNITNGDRISAVRCAVWKNEDQSDLRWIEAVRQEDGSYLAQVFANSFGYALGEYQVHLYGILDSGEAVLIGGTQGEITG